MSDDRRDGDRIDVRFSARLRPGVRIVLDSLGIDADIIEHVTVTDLSDGGMAMTATAGCYVGAIVMVEVPLVGWREAQVVWMAYGRIGCRFVDPLSSGELRSATAADTAFTQLFPGLVPHIATQVESRVEPYRMAASIEVELAFRVSHRGAEILSVTPV
jgi:hypothetical protein